MLKRKALTLQPKQQGCEVESTANKDIETIKIC